MSDAVFARIIADLGEHLGIPALRPTEAGLCQLVFDGRHAVHLMHMGSRGQVLISCPLAAGAPNAAQLALIARGNFMQAAGGAVLCLAPDDSLQVQLGMASQECRPAALLSAIEALLDEARRWEDRLATLPLPATTHTGPPGMFLQV